MEQLQAPLAAHFEALPVSWRSLLNDFLNTSECSALCAKIDARVAAGATVFPATPFAALHATPLEQVRVVILGQDPYHGVDNGIAQAHGLAFSVPQGVRPPPSLRNIYKELAREYGAPVPTSGDLTAWARQGVLLLNAVLTVEQGQAASHAALGWEAVTDSIITQLGASAAPKAFLLWGNYAQKKAALIGSQHLVLKANHPSPLSALRPPVPFMGCGHFERTNQWLRQRNNRIIDWL